MGWQKFVQYIHMLYLGCCILVGNAFQILDSANFLCLKVQSGRHKTAEVLGVRTLGARAPALSLHVPLKSYLYEPLIQADSS